MIGEEEPAESCNLGEGDALASFATFMMEWSGA